MYRQLLMRRHFSSIDPTAATNNNVLLVKLKLAATKKFSSHQKSRQMLRTVDGKTHQRGIFAFV